MVNLRRLFLALTLVMASAFSIAFNNVAPVRADDDRINVSGQFFTQQYGGPGCPSPVGICSSGTSTGKLKGTVNVVILTAGSGVDGSGNPTFVYTASIEIKTKKGNVNGTIAGSVVIATGALRSTITVTNGTGDYEDYTGTINVTGQFNFATGAEVDSYNGVLVESDDDDDDDGDDD